MMICGGVPIFKAEIPRHPQESRASNPASRVNRAVMAGYLCGVGKSVGWAQWVASIRWRLLPLRGVEHVPSITIRG